MAISKVTDKTENSVEKLENRKKDIKGHVWWKLAYPLQELLYQKWLFSSHILYLWKKATKS